MNWKRELNIVPDARRQHQAEFRKRDVFNVVRDDMKFLRTREIRQVERISFKRTRKFEYEHENRVFEQSRRIGFFDEANKILFSIRLSPHTRA